MGGPGGFNMFGQQHQKGDALKEYSVDLTELARNGKLDPTIGRDEEIRRTIQSAYSYLYAARRSLMLAKVLSRRTKSNPVLIGPPGVGKTAILEGLASRIVAEEVPEVRSCLRRAVTSTETETTELAKETRAVHRPRIDHGRVWHPRTV